MSDDRSLMEVLLECTDRIEKFHLLVDAIDNHTRQIAVLQKENGELKSELQRLKDFINFGPDHNRGGVR